MLGLRCRSTQPALATLALAVCALATPAGAHGFGERYELPVPLPLYLFTGLLAILLGLDLGPRLAVWFGMPTLAPWPADFGGYRFALIAAVLGGSRVLYGSLQGAAFYLVLGMGLGALFRSEITAALVGSVILLLNGFVIGFGEYQTRWSPLFNPVAADNINEADLLAFTIQNRIGFALLIAALAALACARAERREQLLRI